MKLILSSSNKGKIKELREIIGEGFEVVSKAEVGLADLEVDETGETLEENAFLKANAIFERVGGNVIADDTGLYVDALDGAPGVYAARYAGENVTYDDNVNKMLKELAGISEEDRGASFKTVICLIRENGNIEYFHGELKGKITDERSGSNGFGYDPIFMPEDYDVTLAELSDSEKNAISHRKRAFDDMVNNI